VVLERVNRGSLGAVWLFSRETLDVIPDVYGELDRLSIDGVLPTFLTQRRIGGVRLLAWITLVVVVPLIYRLTGVIGQFVVTPLVVGWRRRHGWTGEPPEKMPPGFVRLLILAIVIRWMTTAIELPLLERQFWTTIAALLTIVAVTWALLLVNGSIARYLVRRFRASTHAEMTAMLGLLRRLGDLIVVTVAGLTTLNYFGINPTAALAGLGIGGIAVALAAQKTLENVIGGLSIIFDDAVRVGDSLKLGDVIGSVDSIGLRSTRIRTLDRTILSVPNGQIANANIETLSLRDKFRFYHVVGLRLETTSAQMRTAIDEVQHYLSGHPSIDLTEAVRVRLIRLNRFALDVELCAYIRAGDWEGFLETQQDLLLDILGIMERAGAQIALPAQTLHLTDARNEPESVGSLASPRASRFRQPSHNAGS
jgi:MscS family membrane protein